RGGHGVAERAGVGQGAVGVLQPLLQQRLQLAHVLEAEVEGLEPGYRRLGEVVAVELAHRQPHVALGEALKSKIKLNVDFGLKPELRIKIAQGGVCNPLLFNTITFDILPSTTG